MSGSGCEPAKQEYDFSMIPYPGTLKVFPEWELGVKVTLCVILELVSIIGNVLVITIVIKFKRMRTTTNYYLVNLAISDLLVAVMPIWIHVVASLNEFWVFGSFLCKFNPFLQITAMCASMFTLSVLASDRFFAIMFPMKSRVTRRNVTIVLSVVWLTAIAIATPLLFMYFYMERKWMDVNEKYCDEKWPMKSTEDGKCDNGLASKQAYWIVVCGILNWTPMLIMTVAYTSIVIKLKQNKIVPNLGASSKSSVQQKSKRKFVFAYGRQPLLPPKVVIMLFSVLVIFIVCAVPFQTIKIYFLFTQGEEGYKLPSWYATLDFGAVLLLYSNSAFNPIVYAGLNQNFRKGFKDLVNGVTNRNAHSSSIDYTNRFDIQSTMRSHLSTTMIVRQESEAKQVATISDVKHDVTNNERVVPNHDVTSNGCHVPNHDVTSNGRIVSNPERTDASSKL